MNSDNSDLQNPSEAALPGRRRFLSVTSSTAMVAGLTASYGTLGVMAGRFLYPADGSELGWRYVTTVDRLAVGEAMVFESPTGAKIVVACQGKGTGSETSSPCRASAPTWVVRFTGKRTTGALFVPATTEFSTSKAKPQADPPPTRASH